MTSQVLYHIYVRTVRSVAQNRTSYLPVLLNEIFAFTSLNATTGTARQQTHLFVFRLTSVTLIILDYTVATEETTSAVVSHDTSHINQAQSAVSNRTSPYVPLTAVLIVLFGEHILHPGLTLQRSFRSNTRVVTLQVS